MQYRRFGRTEMQVSEMGYGMWGLAGWKDSDDDETWKSLLLSVELGCNFFDTAWAIWTWNARQSCTSHFGGTRLYTAVAPRKVWVTY